MSVSVLDLAGIEEPSSLIQILDDIVMYGLDLLSDHHGEFIGVPSVLSNGAERRDSVPLTSLVIVRSVTGCSVYETCVVLLHICGRDDLVIPIRLRDVKLEDRLVCDAFQFLSLHPLENLELLISALLHDVICLRFEYDEFLLTFRSGHFNPSIIEIRVHCYGHVCRECPRGGCPN